MLNDNNKNDTVITFPDHLFEAQVRKMINKPTGDILQSDVCDIKMFSFTGIGENKIFDLSGIEHFTALESLHCKDNLLESLDLSKNKKLAYLTCDRNKLIELNVTGCEELIDLNCHSNELVKLDISRNKKLKRLDCPSNSLAELDISNNKKLRELICGDNPLKYSDIIGLDSNKTRVDIRSWSTIYTCFPELDSNICGLNKADLILIASRPGMGKTTLALNIASNVALRQKKKALIFSYEMSREQLEMRIFSAVSSVPMYKIRSGRTNNDEQNRLIDAEVMIKDSGLQIYDDASYTIADIYNVCKTTDDLSLLVIDYLQLIPTATNNESDKRKSRLSIVYEISRAMKEMAEKLNVPVICLTQPDRKLEKRADKHPQLSDIDKSGKIIDYTDVVLGLYRDLYYNPNPVDEKEAELLILKNKYGNTGKVILNWDSEFARFN